MNIRAQCVLCIYHSSLSPYSTPRPSLSSSSSNTCDGHAVMQNMRERERAREKRETHSCVEMDKLMKVTPTRRTKSTTQLGIVLTHNDTLPLTVSHTHQKEGSRLIVLFFDIIWDVQRCHRLFTFGLGQKDFQKKEPWVTTSHLIVKKRKKNHACAQKKGEGLFCCRTACIHGHADPTLSFVVFFP